MRPNTLEGDVRVGALLKLSDPLQSEEGLSRSDAALMKQALLEEAERAEGPGWIPLAAGAALAALSLAALLLVRLPHSPAQGAGRDPSFPAGGIVVSNRALEPPGDEPRRAVRMIHFTTAGGTRVVWSLNPDFEIVAQRRPGADRS